MKRSLAFPLFYGTYKALREAGVNFPPRRDAAFTPKTTGGGSHRRGGGMFFFWGGGGYMCPLSAVRRGLWAGIWGVLVRLTHNNATFANDRPWRPDRDWGLPCGSLRTRRWYGSRVCGWMKGELQGACGGGGSGG